jgi:TRAP transporter TAXI family solute receptor
MHFKSTIAALAVGALLTSAASAQTLGMGATKTGYTAQAGAAISKLISQKTSMQMRVQSFGGSSAYVPQVNSGGLEFALANELEVPQAVKGEGIYAGRTHPNIRVATVLQPFRVGIYTREGSDIKSTKDLKGKRVPSDWTSQKIIGVLMDAELANGGLTYDDVIKVPTANVSGGADDFAAGKADVFFFVFGAGKVSETAAKVGGLQVVEIDPSPEAVARMRKHVPPAYPYEVKPSNRNLGVYKPMHVMAYDYLMLTSTEVADDIVYMTVKAMHQNKADLVATFPGMALFNPDAMTKPIPGVDYHPGAIKYFQEIGQWPPR